MLMSKMDTTNYQNKECVDCVHYAACPCQWELNCAACLVLAVHAKGDDEDEADLHLQNQ